LKSGWLFFCFLLISITVKSQVAYESQIWTSAEFGYNFKGPWAVSLTPEVRFRTAPFMARTIFPDLAVEYKLSKRFSAALHYRYETTNEGLGNYYYNHSVLADASYKLKFDKSSLGFRLRTGTVESEEPNPGLLQWESWEMRERIRFNYELPGKKEFYSSVEFFQLPVEGWQQIQQMRFTGGVEWTISKAHKIETGLMFQNRPALKRFNPVIGYTLRIDELKKKQKEKN
jgi:hypothetical protein